MINPNDPDFLWWVGVLHSDCYVYKKDGKLRELRLRVGKKSMKMLYKWRLILNDLTNKNHIIKRTEHTDNRTGKRRIGFEVREWSVKILNKLTEMIPANALKFNVDFISWLERERILSPYLAGIIDADGCIQKRKRYFDKGFEFLLKISDEKADKLRGLQRLLIAENMPKGYITKYKNHNDLWIYINKEFRTWLRDNVVPHLTLEHKIQRIAPGCPDGGE